MPIASSASRCGGRRNGKFRENGTAFKPRTVTARLQQLGIPRRTTRHKMNANDSHEAAQHPVGPKFKI